MGCSIPFTPLVGLPLELCHVPMENLGFKELSASALAISAVGSLLLLDVRPAHHFKVGCLRNSINVPHNIILRIKSIDELFSHIEDQQSIQRGICVICRRGIDSIHVSNHLVKLSDQLLIYNLTGGLLSWSQNVDSDFPVY